MINCISDRCLILRLFEALSNSFLCGEAGDEVAFGLHQLFHVFEEALRAILRGEHVVKSEHAADDVELRSDEVLAQLYVRHVGPDEICLEGLLLLLVVLKQHSVIPFDCFYQRFES